MGVPQRRRVGSQPQLHRIRSPIQRCSRVLFWSSIIRSATGIGTRTKCIRWSCSGAWSSLTAMAGYTMSTVSSTVWLYHIGLIAIYHGPRIGEAIRPPPELSYLHAPKHLAKRRRIIMVLRGGLTETSLYQAVYTVRARLSTDEDNHSSGRRESRCGGSGELRLWRHAT